MNCRLILAIIFPLLILSCQSKKNTPVSEPSQIINVGPGWAGNSVNTVIFRKNSVTTFGETQFISYYDADGHVVIGKRELPAEDWELVETNFTGNIRDAHNSISMAVDGDGYIHLSWDHHNTPLKYARSLSPYGLQFDTVHGMSGDLEQVVSYPEFYNLPDGDLVFFYRSGESGNGNLVINRYRTRQQKWERQQDNLISGEGRRNAYWQACVDKAGKIHLSWVWRESPDAASNHDLCYAFSEDGGKTWRKSNREKYSLPITASTAEIVQQIPEKSELINQTSMTTTPSGLSVIASYWKDKGTEVPQFQMVYFDGKTWNTTNTGFRKTAFSLSGVGTKSIPVSRPQVLASDDRVWLIFRDSDFGSKVMAASASLSEPDHWELHFLTKNAYPSWEPTLDHERWNTENELNLFLQNTTQVDGEGVSDVREEMVQVLTWKP